MSAIASRKEKRVAQQGRQKSFNSRSLHLEKRTREEEGVVRERGTGDRQRRPREMKIQFSLFGSFSLSSSLALPPPLPLSFSLIFCVPMAASCERLLWKTSRACCHAITFVLLSRPCSCLSSLSPCPCLCRPFCRDDLLAKVQPSLCPSKRCRRPAPGTACCCWESCRH